MRSMRQKCRCVKRVYTIQSKIAIATTCCMSKYEGFHFSQTAYQLMTYIHQHLLVFEEDITGFASRIGCRWVSNTELAEGNNEQHVLIPCLSVDFAEYILSPDEGV